MRAFNYTGKDKDGALIKAEIEAENEMAAARVLSARDITPVSIEEKSQANINLFNKISLKEKVVMIRQLATMINAGLPIAQSLKTLEGQSKKANIKKILSSAASDIEGGATLSSSLAGFPETFSQLDITLIASGETSGTLDKSLLTMANQLEKEQSLLRKVRGALIYPIFVLVTVVLIVALMVIYVMPQMESLYSSFGAKLPILTRFMIGLSHFLSRYFPIVLALIIGLSIYAFYAVRHPAGRRFWDNTKIRIPAIKELLIKMYMARFSRTLSGLVSSGVPLLDCLKIVSTAIGNVIYEEIILEAAEKVKSGVALSDALKGNELIPGVVVEMISVGEKTGELDAMLSNLADYFEDEVDTAVKSISGLIEPVMIVLLGGVVTVILLAIMMPIYQIGRIV